MYPLAVDVWLRQQPTITSAGAGAACFATQTGIALRAVASIARSQPSIPRDLKAAAAAAGKHMKLISAHGLTMVFS